MALKGALYWQKKIDEKLRQPEIMKDLAKLARESEYLSASGKWINNRSYVHCYQPSFGPALRSLGLPEDIAEAVSSLKRSSRPLRILEDGPGKGVFLSQLKKKVEGIGIRCKATALANHDAQKLRAKKQSGEMDEVHEEEVERFVPSEPQDAIISMFGGLSYTHPELRKEILLKFAHSLAEDGLMLVGFEFSTDLKAFGAIRYGLSGRPKVNRKMAVEKEMKGIEDNFRKRGFEAKFVALKEVNQWLPTHVLAVRRLR